MIAFAPPVTVIRVPVSAGSFGYGAKLDGDVICIPMNPSVITAIHNSGVFIRTYVSTMSRTEFFNLPDYEGE